VSEPAEFSSPVFNPQENLLCERVLQFSHGLEIEVNIHAQPVMRGEDDNITVKPQILIDYGKGQGHSIILMPHLGEDTCESIPVEFTNGGTDFEITGTPSVHTDWDELAQFIQENAARAKSGQDSISSRANGVEMTSGTSALRARGRKSWREK